MKDIEVIVIEEKKIPYRCEDGFRKIEYKGKLCSVRTVWFSEGEHFLIATRASWLLRLIDERDLHKSVIKQQKNQISRLGEDVTRLNKKLLALNSTPIWKIMIDRIKMWWRNVWR